MFSVSNKKQNRFKPKETKCRCGCGMDINEFFRNELNEVRVIFDEPMPVNSGARCETYNEEVGGSPNSRHKLGKAADIRVKTAACAWRLAKAAMDKGFSVGVYETFLHLDRGRPEPILFRGDY